MVLDDQEISRWVRSEKDMGNLVYPYVVAKISLSSQ